MQSIAAIAEAWLTQRRDGVVARVVAAAGLGPRPAADVLLVDRNGRTGGSLLAGAVQPEVVAAAGELLSSGNLARRLSLVVDSVDAAAAGLTCGGRVEILVQRLDAIPRRLWDALAAGRPAALVTALDGAAAPVVVEPGGRLTGTLGESALDTLAQSEAEAALAHPGTSVTTVALGPRPLLVEAWNPVPHLVVVGASDSPRR
ncbi:MAG: XdhC family protein [Ilumatobacteraceae bacterium]